MNRVQPWSGPLDKLAAIASAVFITDFASKQWALRHFAPADASVASGWHLAVINNVNLGWGIGSSDSALPLTLLLTAAIAALVLRICRPLTAVDSSAPTMLGLLVGSGAANLADALIPPHGVVDFIAFTSRQGVTTSFNVADIVLALGLTLSVRSMWRIVLAMRGGANPPPRPRRPSIPGALPMRDRALLSAGHALLAMCAFIWLYSMALAWMPDQGRSAPNSLLCGVGVFAVVFMISRARSRFLDRHAPLATGRSVERVVLDGSLPAFAQADDGRSTRSEEMPRAPGREKRQAPRADEPPVA